MATRRFRRSFSCRPSCRPRAQRKGAIAVLAAFLMIVLVALAAFAVDLGYLTVARTELQRTADSAALAASWDLIDEAALTGNTSMVKSIAKANKTAEQFVSLNAVCGTAPRIKTNRSNKPDGDVVVGTYSGGGLTFNDTEDYDAVLVRVARSADRNGEVPMFFAHVLGIQSRTARAQAISGLLKKIGGFRTPVSRENVPILPITLELETWNDLVEGHIDDDGWSWDQNLEAILPGRDRIPEVSLYPQNTGSPGNCGTVNIGTSANSTAYLSRQIRNGLSPADFAYHGGELKLDANGELPLSGNPGLSAAIADELIATSGQTRIIAIYKEVSGSGNNAVYTIVKFVGVRIMYVQLTGKNKMVTVQPANVLTAGAIEATTDGTSNFVYSAPRLLQ